MEESKGASERREFIRLDYTTPIAYKVCREETISKLLEGYTANVSQSGILCRIKDKVQPDDLLWISFDRATLTICADLERRAFIYQNGIIGKVVRIEPAQQEEYSVGVQFLTREEKDLTHIHPKLYFISKSKEEKDV
ncbi:MAG: PilZ domain-containing protein [Candidatus Omnitrophica bacterium]|nr:PilZ domain-containing protein [Candidatus Omnitrophota bacterium]